MHCVVLHGRSSHLAISSVSSCLFSALVCHHLICISDETIIWVTRDNLCTVCSASSCILLRIPSRCLDCAVRATSLVVHNHLAHSGRRLAFSHCELRLLFLGRSLGHLGHNLQWSASLLAAIACITTVFCHMSCRVHSRAGVPITAYERFQFRRCGRHLHRRVGHNRVYSQAMCLVSHRFASCAFVVSFLVHLSYAHSLSRRGMISG